MTSLHRAIAIATGAFVVTLAASSLAADAGCVSSLACEQCDVSGYAPTPMAKPLGPNAQACADSDITAFVNACLGASSSASACSTWQGSAPAACESCLFTQNTAASWGLLVCTSTGCDVNIPGCVDLELAQVSQEKQAGGAGSCGDAFNASYGCQDYACGACSTTDFNTCASDAIANECKSYDTPVESMPASPTAEARTRAATADRRRAAVEVVTATQRALAWTTARSR